MINIIKLKEAREFFSHLTLRELRNDYENSHKADSMSFDRWLIEEHKEAIR